MRVVPAVTKSLTRRLSAFHQAKVYPVIALYVAFVCQRLPFSGKLAADSPPISTVWENLGLPFPIG